MRALMLVLLVLAACTPDFQSVSRVVDLRVLAVRTEPPEAQYDASSIDPVQVTLLAVDPVQRAPFTVTARACGPTDSLRCDQGDVVALGTVSTDFTLALPPSVLALAQANDKLAGLNGIHVQLELTVADGDPNGPVVATKTEVFSARGTAPNHNPIIDALELTKQGQPFATLAPGATLQLNVGEDVGLRPVLHAGARETYTVTDLTGQRVTLTEQPRYAFFATGPIDFDHDTADEPLGGVAPPDGLTRIRATAAQPEPRSFWVVVRDGRGGESWIEMHYTAP